jgi:hypothetical protein
VLPLHHSPITSISYKMFLEFAQRIKSIPRNVRRSTRSVPALASARRRCFEITSRAELWHGSRRRQDGGEHVFPKFALPREVFDIVASHEIGLLDELPAIRASWLCPLGRHQRKIHRSAGRLRGRRPQLAPPNRACNARKAENRDAAGGDASRLPALEPGIEWHLSETIL